MVIWGLLPVQRDDTGFHRPEDRSSPVALLHETRANQSIPQGLFHRLEFTLKTSAKTNPFVSDNSVPHNNLAMWPIGYW